jgi:AraC-like DNA-binding protein
METSARTLSRRLSDCGTGFQFLVDELRYRKSCDLLSEKGRPINDIAWSVGFTDQANFNRFFRRMAGMAPREFRKLELRTLH